MINLDDLFKKKNGISFQEFEEKTKEYPLPDVQYIQEKIIEASREGIHVTVIGDYDVDGQVSGAISDLCLTELGCEHTIRLPKRFSEGYGLSEKIIDEIESGIVMTFDNGIVANQAVKKAKEKGLTVIITDHHLPQEDLGLPEADFILDPHIYNDDFKGFRDYCGAGLAYKIFKDIVSPSTSEKILQLATIATIADSVPLYGENRWIVKRGLESLNQNFKTIEYNGIKKNDYLFENANITKGLYFLFQGMGKHHYIEEEDIAFYISPALNAPSRLLDDGAVLSMNLLAEDKDDKKAADNASNLIELNKNRRKITNDFLKKIENNIRDNCLFSTCPMIIYEKDISEGLLGILAGKISEKYKVPTIIFAEDSHNPEILKGSGRKNDKNNPDINLFEMLNDFKSYFIRFGGHPSACGVSIEKSKLEDFRSKINEKYFSYEPIEKIEFDAEISTKDVLLLAEQLKKYKPFGNGNNNFTFKINDFDLVPNGNKYYDIKGENENSLFLYGNGYKAVNFSLAQRYLGDKSPKNLILIGNISNNYYYDEYRRKMMFSIQFQFTDYQKREVKKKTTSLQQRLQTLS